MGPLKFEFKRPAMSVSGEVGSLSELIGALQEEGSSLTKMFGSDMELMLQSLGDTTALGTGTVAETNEQTAETTDKKERKPRGPNKPKVEMQPPNAPPPIPVDMTPGANGIPAGLARDPATNTAPAMAAAAPPPPPPPPPAPPVPPSGVLAGKIIPHMEDIASKSPDGGKAWVDWLATSGIVVAGATFEEAMKVIRMQSDDKLKPVADALGIAA
jgi:hypothetical protein